MSFEGGKNRIFIETDSFTYALSREEIKNDPIVYFTSTTQRDVRLNFPTTFEGGHTVEAYQGFSQGLGDIIVDAPFQSPLLNTFQRPDAVSFITLSNSKIRILELGDTVCAYANVNPNLFINITAGEITSYRDRYRLRIYNTGSSSLEFGLDDIPIESGWSSVGRYSLLPNQEKYVPLAADTYVFQYTNWGSTGGIAPEGGRVVASFTRLSDHSKTVEITSNSNGTYTFTLYKKTLLTLF